MIFPAALIFLARTGGNPATQTQEQVPPKVPAPRVKDAVTPPKIELNIAPSTDLPNAPLTSDEAARIALKLQPSLGDAVGALQSAEGRTRQAGAGLNPQFVVNAGYDQISSIAGPTVPSTEAPTGLGPLGTSPVYRYTSAAALRQLVFDFNQTRNTVRQNRALEDVARANLTRAQSDLVQAVKGAFYSFTNAQRLVRVNEDNVANRQRQLDLTTSRLSSGLGLPSDVVTAETSKSQAVLALNVARDGEQQARVNLLQLMGVDPGTPMNVVDAPESTVTGGGPQTLIDTALRSRPEVQAALQALKASQFGLSAARALNLPAIYAAVSAGVAGSDIPLKDNSVALGIGVQFPLYDGGTRSGAVQQAKGQIHSAESDLKSALLTVRADVVSAYLGLVSAEQRVAIVDTEVANAKEGVRVAEGRYSAGLGSFLDITNAQTLLLGALTDESTVRVTLDLARTRLRHALGKSLSS